MDNMQIFKNDSFGSVRVMDQKGEPWFVAADVCRALELGNSRQALVRLDDDEKGVISNDTPGGPQEMSVVNEPGLYALVLGSRKPEAKAFKRWITHEVIPAIRRHGLYAAPETVEAMLANPDTMIATLTALKEEQTKRKALESRAEKDAPKVLFADAVSTSGTSILVRELALLLQQNGVEIGQQRLFRWLKENSYLVRRNGSDRNMPTQKSMEMGLFEIRETTIVRSDGSVTISKTAKVTGKGQQYFVNKFLKTEGSK